MKELRDFEKLISEDVQNVADIEVEISDMAPNDFGAEHVIVDDTIYLMLFNALVGDLVAQGESEKKAKSLIAKTMKDLEKDEVVPVFPKDANEMVKTQWYNHVLPMVRSHLKLTGKVYL
jgi:hypothetical protein